MRPERFFMSRSLPLSLRRLSLVALSLGAIGFTACSEPAADAPPDPAPSATAAPEDPPADAPPDLQAATSRQGETYNLSVSGQEHYAAGELGSFGIVLAPRGEWHVNQEYPIHVELAAADGVTLPKTELERVDAAEFAEAGARFDVPFTAAAAGSPRVAAKVSFAMCTEENCMFEEQTVALALPVQ
jgi:hypothetical protein